MELEIFNIQSEQQQQRDDDLRSPLVSAVRANCLLLFVEGTNLGHQNRQKTNAQNACNKLPVYSISTRPVEVDTCTHWVPIFLIAACVITFPLDSLFHFSSKHCALRNVLHCAAVFVTFCSGGLTHFLTVIFCRKWLERKC